jgi:hypothetical protein
MVIRKKTTRAESAARLIQWILICMFNRVGCAACLVIEPIKGHHHGGYRDCSDLICSRNQNLLYIPLGIDEMTKKFKMHDS